MLVTNLGKFHDLSTSPYDIDGKTGLSYKASIKVEDQLMIVPVSQELVDKKALTTKDGIDKYTQKDCQFLFSVTQFQGRWQVKMTGIELVQVKKPVDSKVNA